MKRILIHWTAGTHAVSALDKKHYHFIIDGAGNVHEGNHPVKANAAPIKGEYAAHTLNLNGDSIGVSLAAMANAVERPFSAGKYPITAAQESALTKLLVKLCDAYNIPVTPQTVLTHAEVQPTLGVKQKGKWDITWLPGMPGPRDPVEVGNIIRDRVRKARAVTPEPNPTGVKRPSILQAIIDILKGLWK